MKRRSFLKSSALAAGATFTATSVNATPILGEEKDFYELKVFQLTGGGARNQLKKYYTDAVIPFLNKRGAKVGAFNEYSLEDPPVMYILHAHKSPMDYYEAVQSMKSDAAFLEAAKEYSQLPADNPIFVRYETFLMEAFDAIPRIKQPDSSRGLLELRTYESYNEDAGIRKVKMFNDEELPLFEKVGLHPVFFGQLIAGQYMPALTYMLWFKDMDERTANWAKFSGSPEWNTMKNKPEYANTVSKVKKKFLIPADFSQL
ncbi:NIPSNAP family protein [Maribellus maritimus]|uniref:NIPSNAP family protein n=1 Tax=Maribellus maritimus TaxID=2870838 RepID=UPI001EEC4554|nr:NIPSNAP family protein [Maribellus maritimus]MCG6187684.1 NIPSNAP family protein [Maribellus maritimus]